MHEPIERILCPIDFSEFSVPAYDYACSLAQHYGATLYVEHVVELWRYPSACFAGSADDYDRFCESLTNTAIEHLKSFVQSHSPGGFSPPCVLPQGTAIDCILSFAQEEAINLIVMGTHGVRGFDRLALGSVTEKVLRKARCSVLAVHGKSESEVQPGAHWQTKELREILFCTDFSDYSNRAFDYALSIATEYHARLTLVHVVEGISRLHCAENTAKCQELLDRLVPESARQNCAIATIVRSGKAYAEISRLAQENHADLVVMAVHGRNTVDSAVFGSTTYRVVLLGNCPVLAVHC